MRSTDAMTNRATRKIVIAVLAAGAVLVIAAAGYRYTSRPAAPEEAPDWLEIERVRSGDTVILKHGDKLVYRGIQAPAEGEPLFDEARLRNEALVMNQRVRGRFEDSAERDKKSRLLAYAFVEKKLINAELVREGLAHARITTDTVRFKKEIVAAAAEARKARRGLWAQPAPAAEPEYWADPKYALFHRNTCAEKSKAKPERVQTVASRAAALDRGWAPCRDCKP
jgi:micrococcal nuclease